MSAPSRPALDPEAREGFREAGRIAFQARTLGASRIRPGVLLREVMEEVEDYIRSQGAGVAFPAQTSRNHIAAHYCPGPADATVYEEGDMVKIDVGVEVDGWIADTAQTVYLGREPRLERLRDASLKALQAAIAAAGPGVRVSRVSAAIEQAIAATGFRPVYNLTGHGLDRWQVHTAPQVPPTPDRHGDRELLPGMVVAVEPFATDGAGTVHEQGRAEVFMILRPPRKRKGIDPEVWRHIEALHGLPFARRSIPRPLHGQRLESTLARLIRTGCLLAFPPLADPDPGVRISQHEHTLLILEDGVEVLTGGGDPQSLRPGRQAGRA